jgi:FkbM family methyltransferase
MVFMFNSLTLPRIARSLRFLDRFRGWRRLAELTVADRPAPFIVNNNGILFSGNLNSFIDRQIFLYGGYEADCISKFIENVPLNRRTIILDIGANAGNHSLNFALAFEKVHAFEPNPILWDQFSQNVKINELDERVVLHRVGLGDRDEALVLHMIDKPNLGLGTFSHADQYDMPLKPAAKCEVKQGDSFLEVQGITAVDAIKIDVQGFELEVLRGLQKTMSKNRPVIWIEIGSGTSQTLKRLDDLRRVIPYDFKLKRLDEATSASELSGSGIVNGDYIIIPN